VVASGCGCFLQFYNSAYRCAQERPTVLPITFFSEEPGSLSDAEVRLLAFLAVDTNSRARLGSGTCAQTLLD